MHRRSLVRNSIIVLLGLASIAIAGDYKLIKSIPVAGDGRWDALTIDADAHRLYVPRSTHTQVLDTESGKVVADWPDTQGVHCVALAPDKGLAFTSNGRSNTV